MWLICVLFGCIFNNALAFILGEPVHNGDDHNYVYTILTLKNGIVSELQTEKQFGYKCVATAISQNHLVTAGHCLLAYWNIDAKESLDIYYLHQAYVHMSLEHIENAAPIAVTDVQFHPNFQKENCTAYDIAVVTLPKINWKRRMLPMCLHMHEDLKAVSLINAQKNYSYPYSMNTGIFEIEAAHECRGSKSYIQNNNIQICTRCKSCQSEAGDSGAPLITTTKDSCLVGILSCANRNWTIFYNIITSDWIENIVNPPPNYRKGKGNCLSPTLLHLLMMICCICFIV